LAQPYGDGLAGLVAAPLDPRGVRLLARVRYVVDQPDEELDAALARNDHVVVVHVEVLRQPERVDVVVAVDPRVAEDEQRLERMLGHQRARQRQAALHLLGTESQRSRSASQSAVSGRYLYGMLLQT